MNFAKSNTIFKSNFGVRFASLGALFIAIVALAFAPIFVRLCDAGPTAIAFWRMAFAIPILFAGWMFLPRSTAHPLVAPNLRAYSILIIAGISFALNLIAWNLGLNFTSVANATLFVNFAPLVVILISWQVFRQKLPLRLIFGMLVAIVGGLLLVLPKLNAAEATLSGDGLCLLAACFYGIYLMSIQIAREYFSTFAIMSITTLVTGLTALLSAFLLGENLMAGSWADWRALIALALVVQVLGQSMIAYALAELPATLSSVVLLLQPVIAAVAAMLIFEEHLLIVQWLGMLVVLFGIATTKLSNK